MLSISFRFDLLSYFKNYLKITGHRNIFSNLSTNLASPMYIQLTVTSPNTCPSLSFYQRLQVDTLLLWEK